MKRIDRIGKVSGKLTVIADDKKNQKVTVSCACGTVKQIHYTNWYGAKSCGCLTRSKVGLPVTGHPLYELWCNLKKRAKQCKCTIDPRWNDLETMTSEIGLPPSKDHVLTRIDWSKGFCKENCKWVTRAEIGKYKPKKLFTIGRASHTIPEWCIILGVSHQSVYAILKKVGHAKV